MTEQNQQSSLLGKIAAYTEILSKDSSSTIFVSLSEGYRKMGMLDDAKNVAEKGLLSHPDFAPAHIVLARILCQQGDYQGSETSFKKALEIDPISLAALVGYARLQILLGNESKAREILLEARNQSPADSVINKLLLSLPEEPPSIPQVEPFAEVETQPTVKDVTSDLSDVSPLQSAKVAQPILASKTLADLYLKQGLELEALEMYRQLSVEKPNDLMLRRQIRDLEGRVTEPVKDRQDDSPVTDSLEEQTPDSLPEYLNTAETELMDPSGQAEVDHLSESTEKLCVENMNPADLVMKTFDRWLINIQKRRNNV